MGYGMEEYLKMKKETESWHKNICPCCNGVCPTKELEEDTHELCTGCEIKHYRPVHEIMDRFGIGSGEAYLRMARGKEEAEEKTKEQGHEIFLLKAKHIYDTGWETAGVFSSMEMMEGAKERYLKVKEKNGLSGDGFRFTQETYVLDRLEM